MHCQIQRNSRAAQRWFYDFVFGGLTGWEFLFWGSSRRVKRQRCEAACDCRRQEAPHAVFPLTPKRTFLRPKNLSKTSRILGLGVSKIPVLSCIRPFIHSRTYTRTKH